MSMKNSNDTIKNRTRYLKFITVLNISIIVSHGILFLQLRYAVMYSNYLLRGKLLFKMWFIRKRFVKYLKMPIIEDWDYLRLKLKLVLFLMQYYAQGCFYRVSISSKFFSGLFAQWSV